MTLDHFIVDDVHGHAKLHDGDFESLMQVLDFYHEEYESDLGPIAVPWRPTICGIETAWEASYGYRLSYHGFLEGIS